MRASPLSVSELNEYVRRSLAGDPMLQGIAIRGEISNFKRHTSGHLYFTLKDEASRISCVMFRQHAQMLRFAPQDGMSVLLSGSVSLYTASGSYQFYGEAMASDGAGALYELYLRTRDRLQKEGLFDVSRKKPLPLLPRGVGIVTARTGAVLHDIMTVAKRRFPGLPLYLRAAQVQGKGAETDLVVALNELAALPQVEVIIIGRGGGSLEDLWAFNEEVLVRAIAACPLPVISAVGHETDVTLSDFAADVRAATPSAAAEIAVPLKTELLLRIEAQRSLLYQAARQQTDLLQAKLQQTLSALQHNRPDNKLKVLLLRLDNAMQRMTSGMNTSMRQLDTRVSGLIQRLKAAGPEQTLRRGYVIALDESRPLQSVTQVGETLTLQFYDGKAFVKTLRIEEENTL